MVGRAPRDERFGLLGDRCEWSLVTRRQFLKESKNREG